MEMIKETAKVVRQQQIDEGIFDMELSFPKGAALAKPGQFIAMYCNDKSKLLPRPISICGINKDGKCGEPHGGEDQLAPSIFIHESRIK